jgi:hypothetical protein
MSAEQLPLFFLPPATPRPRERHLQLGPLIVPYELRQAAGRRLAMCIDERGLRVGAPRHLSLRQIEDFVRGHADWVLAKLDEFATRQGRRHLRIHDGLRLPLLDGEATVRVTPGGNRCRWHGEGSILELASRPGADLEALARRALQRRALEHFSARSSLYAAALGLALPRLGLSSARTRWGSCSVKGGIRLNWRLIHLPARYADYVVAHELAHLVEMNHGPRFWALVESVVPDWRSRRAELKARAADIPLI